MTRSGELGMVNGEPKLLALSCKLLAKRTRRPVVRLASSFILHPSSFRHAFTLVELLVSLVILVGMMTLIATIFATAGKSSGVAQAQARLHRQLLQVADTIRVDLAATLAGTDASGAPKGVLAIYGAAVEANDTAKTPARVRRADVLMLLTQQQFEPFIYQQPAGTITTFDGYKHVVYGHADLGKLNTAGQWIGVVRHVENARAEGWPASEWHLARRVVGFASSNSDGDWTDTTGWPPTSAAILGTDLNLITDAVAGPISPILSRTMPGYYAYAWNGLEMGPEVFYFQDGLGNRFYWNGQFYLLAEGPPDNKTYWWAFNSSSSSPPSVTNWERTHLGTTPLLPPVSLSQWPPFHIGYYSQNRPGDDKYRFWPDWFYAPYLATGANDSYRTRIDPMPPPGMPGRTAAYFLPSCSEFRVEFTYDDPREIVINPVTGQPFPGPDLNGDGNADVPAASPVNWQTVPPGHIFVWTGLSTDTNIYTAPNDLRDRTFPFRWPRALRITIRAYAPGGALDYPIEHSLIHVWQ